MEYQNVTYFAKKWNLNERRIRALCTEGRIFGAKKVGKTWMIPLDAEKPIDKRLRQKEDIFYNKVNFSLIDEKKKKIDSYRPFSQNTLKQLRDNLVVDWTYNSNAIEGNTLTLKETKVVLENGITIQGKTLKEHLEAINHKDAIEYIYELVKNKATLTENDIRSIHYLVLKEIDKENAGKYRTENVRIAGAKHIPPRHIDVPFEMQKLIDRYGKWNNLHPVVRASYLHGEFVKIHPFIDGNGRTARLLLNLELMKNGYPPVVIKVEKRHDYYEALDTAHMTGDYTDFINIIVDLINESEDMYLYLLE